MASAPLTQMLQQLRRINLVAEGHSMSDGRLLNEFFEQGNEAAFEVLVHRYGPMVLGVCQRMLRNAHDSEDAFQAVFLVVVRKGRGLVGRETIGNWLYGVAYHTALKARATAMLRRRKEAETPVKADVQPAVAEGWETLRPLLDQELSKLPDKYREAVVLCDVMGKSRKDADAAEQLGISEGTLSSRLATARQKLSDRLQRLGVTLSSAALAVVVGQNTASACVPPQLVACTVEAASAVATGAAVAGTIVTPTVAALTEGVLKTMLVAKCKSALAVVMGFFLLTLGATGLSVLAAQEDGEKPVPAPSRENGGLTLAEFEKLHKEVAFAKKGVWSIPWHVSLSEARARAAREKKPIYLSLGSGTVLSTC